MNQTLQIKKEQFSAPRNQVFKLFRNFKNPEKPARRLLWLIGLIFPSGIAGALYGYVRAYNRFMLPNKEYPVFADIKPIVRVSMIIFGIIFFIVFHIIFGMLFKIFIALTNPYSYHTSILPIIFGYLLLNLILTSIAFRIFNGWYVGVNNYIVESNKFGSAHFASAKDLSDLENKEGVYIGGNYTFSDKGHILTVAGTRGGKGTSLIIPNLLGLGGYAGSMVVIDPKGENAAITARYQREAGRKVVILNPWDLLVNNIGKSSNYNPLDIVFDKTNIHLVDDIQIIAEMIVPIDKSDRDKFFTDNARALVAGLLLHLVTSQEKENQTLSMLWRWVRYSNDAWINLLADMAVNDDPLNGETVRNAANEIAKLMNAGDRTYGTIIATVLQATDFLKSPALQKSLQSDFSPYELADGNSIVYIIIPADKLQSHSRWLRLLVTTMMRGIIRKPDKRVTFLLDEFAALGYLPEIETALSTYAGFNITVWPILQSLIQLKGLYHDSWETFTANCTVRHYFSVNDNFTADYVSAAMGQTSHVIYKTRWFGISDAEANARPLVAPDELRRGSGENIFTFIGDRAPTFYSKLPYYFITNLKGRFDDNPYYKN